MYNKRANYTENAPTHIKRGCSYTFVYSKYAPPWRHLGANANFCALFERQTSGGALIRSVTYIF